MPIYTTDNQKEKIQEWTKPEEVRERDLGRLQSRRHSRRLVPQQRRDLGLSPVLAFEAAQGLLKIRPFTNI